MSKNWQTVTKRERERLVEQKRTLKRERKQAAAAAKAAERRGETAPELASSPSGTDEPAEETGSLEISPPPANPSL